MGKLHLLFLTLFCLSNSACALPSLSKNYDGLGTNYQADSQALARQSAIELAKIYPAGQTTLTLADEKSYFSSSLENALRQQGFAIATNGLEINYVLDEIQGEATPTAYLQVKSPKQNFGFVRHLNKNVVVAPVLPATEPIPLQAPVPLTPTDNFVAESKVPETLPVFADIPAIVAPIVSVDPVVNETSQKSLLEPVNDSILPVSQDLKLRPVPLNEWALTPGSLQAQLYTWAVRADYALVWKANVDYDIETFSNFKGDFVTAVSQLFNALHKNGYMLRASIYEQNKVLAVMEN